MSVTKKDLKLKENKKERLFFRKWEYSVSDIPVATIHVPKTKLIEDLKHFGGDDKLSIIGDKVFKALFYNESKLKHGAMFISQFLNIAFEEALEEIRLLKNELNVERVKARGYVCDYVADLRDNTINIEMNNSNKFERNLIYLYLLVNRKNEVGAKNLILPQAGFQFNLCNFYFDGHDKTIEYFPQKNRANELLTFNNQIVAIFIPNIWKKYYNGDELLYWEKMILVMATTSKSLARKIAKGDEYLMEIIEDLEKFESNGYLLESCDHDDEVFDGGFICGKEEGLEQGREEGKLDVAKNLIKLDVPIDMIKKATSLSEKVIKTLML